MQFAQISSNTIHDVDVGSLPIIGDEHGEGRALGGGGGGGARRAGGHNRG